jgi:hypothetical protein
MITIMAIFGKIGIFKAIVPITFSAQIAVF